MFDKKSQVDKVPAEPFDDFPLPVEPDVPVLMIPHNREMEEAVLGSVMIDGDLYPRIAEFLHAEDFYIVRHQMIWRAFQTCADFGRAIDFLTVGEVLDGLGDLGEVGGPAYLARLTTNIPFSFNAVEYARIVESYSVRRKLIGKANDIAALAYNTAVDIETTLAHYDRVVGAEKLNYSQKTTSQDADEAAVALLEMIESDAPLGVMTGFEKFDKPEELGGLYGAILTIGDSSFGKSAWWLQICEQVAEHMGKRALYCGLEASNMANVLRRVGGLSGVEFANKKVRAGSLSQAEKDALRDVIVNQYLGRFGGRLQFNSKATTVRDIEREIRIFKPDLVVVDQINQLEDADFGGENKTTSMLHTFTALKRLSERYGCAVSVIHAIDPEESKKFFKRNAAAQNGKKQKNAIPDINAIPWARQIKHITDVMLILMPEANQQLVGASALDLAIWIMKDRDGQRFLPTLWHYDLDRQWFTDRGVPSKKVPAMQPSQGELA